MPLKAAPAPFSSQPRGSTPPHRPSPRVSCNSKEVKSFLVLVVGCVFARMWERVEGRKNTCAHASGSQRTTSTQCASSGTVSHWPGIHHVGYSSESQPSSSFCLPSSIIKNISHFFKFLFYFIFFAWVPATILKVSPLQLSALPRSYLPSACFVVSFCLFCFCEEQSLMI